MKKILFITFIITLLFSFLNAQDNLPSLPKTGKNLESFIPKGWKTLMSAKGDLNKDGFEDIAAIIEQPDKGKKDADASNARIIFVILKTKEGFSLSVQAAKAVLLADEGGVFGDPLSGLTIERGSILLSFYGGASEKWGITARFRYQDSGWYMIGYTFETHTVDGSGSNDDYNLLTGDKINTTYDENGKSKTTNSHRGKKKLINLTDYIASDFSEKDF
jgi:hypothetical protein